MPVRQRVLAGAQLAAAQRDGGVEPRKAARSRPRRRARGACRSRRRRRRLGTVTTTAPVGSPWKGWKVALISHSAPPMSASASTARMRRGEAAARRAGRAAAVGARVAGVGGGRAAARGRRGAARGRRGGGRRGGLAAHGHHRLGRLPRDVVVLLHPGGLELLRGLRERILRHGLGLALRFGPGSGSSVEPGALDGGLGRAPAGGVRSTWKSSGGRGSGGAGVAGQERLRRWGRLAAAGGALGGGPGALLGAALIGFVEWRRGTCCSDIVAGRAVGRAETPQGQRSLAVSSSETGSPSSSRTSDSSPSTGDHQAL